MKQLKNASSPVSNYDFFFETCVLTFEDLDTVKRTWPTYAVLMFYDLFLGSAQTQTLETSPTTVDFDSGVVTSRGMLK